MAPRRPAATMVEVEIVSVGNPLLDMEVGTLSYDDFLTKMAAIAEAAKIAAADEDANID